MSNLSEDLGPGIGHSQTALNLRLPELQNRQCQLVEGRQAPARLSDYRHRSQGESKVARGRVLFDGSL
jgi:hypothetical protein